MRILLVTFAILFLSTRVEAVPAGMVEKTTDKSVSVIVEKAKKLFKAKEITLFKVVEHHKGAAKVGLSLPETVTVIFGNPKLGTPLMINKRTVAIDLPQKLLVYRDGDRTHLLYNDPAYLKDRHALSDLPQLMKISKALDGLTSKMIE